jgi:hypothetical protein
VKKDGQEVRFTVTDLQKTVPVVYRGLLPDLFREGQGVIAEGTLAPTATFAAREVLAKHDENYMPPEVAKALKESVALERRARRLAGAQCTAAPPFRDRDVPPAAKSGRETALAPLPAHSARPELGCAAGRIMIPELGHFA